MASMTVGEKLKQIRKRKKITQVVLSKTAGIAQSTISAIEHNENSPSVATITLIANALGVDVNELINETKNAATQESDSKRVEIVGVYDKLNEDSKRQAMAYLRFLLNEQDKKA